MIRRAAAIASLLFALPCGAQKIANSAMVWFGVFGDSRFSARSSMYWDLQIRRANEGAIWQQFLTSVGYTRDLSAHWRGTIATEFTHGYRYGPFPAKSNTIESRSWLQLAGTHAFNRWTWNDRNRVELRMLKAVGEFAPPGSDFQPTVVRLRRQDRVQHPLNSRGSWYGAGVTEFFVNVAPAKSRVAMLEQSRAQVLIGRQLSARNRVETGYGTQLFNRRGGYELNHILLFYYRTTVPFR